MIEHIGSSIGIFEKIVFFDRDGTLNISPKSRWVTSADELNLIQLDIALLQQLVNFGFGFVVVTNQRGIHTGDISRESYDLICEKLLMHYKSKGVEIASVLTCPHGRECFVCRKPSTGLIDFALKKYGIKSTDCWMIGDQLTDQQCASVSKVPFKMVDNSNFGQEGRLTTNEALWEILSDV